MTPDNIISLEEIGVLYEEASNPKTSSQAFNKLETKLKELLGKDFLKGRKCYGVCFEDKYFSCISLKEGDKPDEWKINTYTIPKGNYLKKKINDWTKNLDKIGSTFEAMEKECSRDRSRPLIEFYRSHIDLILMMPVKEK